MGERDDRITWPRHLALACRRLAAAPSRPEALRTALEGLRCASGAERAFLVESDPPPRWARAVVSSPARVAGRGSFSRTVAARALAGDRPLFLPDLHVLATGVDGDSLRALSLRAALAIPVPVSRGPRAALVLDTRAHLALGPPEWELVGRAFASLVALVRDRDERAFVGETARPAAPRTEDVGSRAMRELRDEIRRAARVPLPVLVTGPPGSGKELAARALHAEGPRAGRPFVAINCASIPDALLEREMFGALRGAYTGADRDHPGLLRQAEGGSLFLDEIGDMPAALQAKLLRVVQEGAVRPVGGLEESPVDVRIIAATHRDLDQLVERGGFRADLRDRLAILTLRVPALAERREDIPALAGEILERLARRCGLPVPALSDRTIGRLQSRAWPGNVRELEAVLARALLRADDGILDLEDDGPRSPEAGLERAMVAGALAACGGSMTKAALRIGWTRQKLHRRMVALGLKPDRRQTSSDP